MVQVIIESGSSVALQSDTMSAPVTFTGPLDLHFDEVAFPAAVAGSVVHGSGSFVVGPSGVVQIASLCPEVSLLVWLVACLTLLAIYRQFLRLV